jgi:hypothetical protein
LPASTANGKTGTRRDWLRSFSRTAPESASIGLPLNIAGSRFGDLSVCKLFARYNRALQRITDMEAYNGQT